MKPASCCEAGSRSPLDAGTVKTVANIGEAVSRRCEGDIAATILAFDTAGSACSVAAARGSRVLAAERSALRHGHAEVLMGMIERVMAQAGLAAGELDRLAISTGPGGFTGIRAGIAAARGIAVACGVRLVGVSSFDAVAATLADRAAAFRLVALDSRRAELYVQMFDAACAALGAPVALLPTHLSGYVRELSGDATLAVAGDDTERAMAALAGHAATVVVAPDSAPDALGVLEVARRRLVSGAPDGTAAPLYLRPPDVTFPKTGSPAGSRPR